jgi:hypothetical protein
VVRSCFRRFVNVGCLNWRWKRVGSTVDNICQNPNLCNSRSEVTSLGNCYTPWQEAPGLSGRAKQVKPKHFSNKNLLNGPGRPNSTSTKRPRDSSGRGSQRPCQGTLQGARKRLAMGCAQKERCWAMIGCDRPSPRSRPWAVPASYAHPGLT